MVRNQLTVAAWEDRFRENEVLSKLLPCPLVSVSAHIVIPQFEYFQFMELLEEGDLAINHVPSTFTDILLFTNEIWDIIFVFSNSNETSFSKNDLTRKSFTLIFSFFENKTGVIRIRINF